MEGTEKTGAGGAEGRPPPVGVVAGAGTADGGAGLLIEVLGGDEDPRLPSEAEVRRLCTITAAARGCSDGHVAVQFVHERAIAQLNERHRGRASPTDVLSFPIDGLHGQNGVERELGDVVICPEQTQDIREAIVHGVLHLLGMDHETDDGEMLQLQDRILAEAGSAL